jgi:hypothetical protein
LFQCLCSRIRSSNSLSVTAAAMLCQRRQHVLDIQQGVLGFPFGV